MIPDTVIKELESIVGQENLTTRHDDLTNYSSDATKLEFMPDAVAFPGAAEQISRILLLANREYFPVIPRGAGSGTSGGALAVMGGLVLAMNRFNRILSIDQDNLIVKTEPGVITAHLQEEVEKLGLFYPPDPASINISTIGGNVAECAGGLRAVKYGVTRDYVLGLEVVLPTGEIMKTGVETAKGVVGYDLTRLIVGSEGTLAVITSVTLRLIPKPATKKTMMAFFHHISSSVQTVSDIIRNKIVPTTLEFMDRLSIDCVRNEMGLPIPDETAALLLIEVDGDEDLTARDAKRVQEICVRSGAILFQAASGKEEAERLWQARRDLSPALLKLRPGKVSQDIVVPRSRLSELIAFLEQLSQKYQLPIPAFGHAGDGNIHVNIMLDKSVPKEVENATAAVKDLFRKVIEMGGTISGEHGIGITKAPYMEMEISGPALELMSRLKKAFDPNGILNPGKIFS
ncbi:MAG: glycolate oxidase subunit GlcD [Nitrospira bacterium SG8_3]|nr:MAG: glycolate oxidase subunit GlcD [Nitrospira bacterium SG8_3]